MALWELSPRRGGNGYRCRAAVLCAPVNARRRGDEGGAWPQGPWSGLFGDEQAEEAAPGGAGGAAAEAAPGRGAQARSQDEPKAEAKPTQGNRQARAGKPDAGPTGGRAGRPAPPPPSACRLALTEAIAIAPSIPDIKGAGGCGGEDLVRLEAVVLPDKRRVSVKPAAILRCAMASAIADWIRTDMAPLAASLGSTISDLDNFDSFECRGRNRVAGARLSEHGRANALDIRAIKLANGRSISLTDRTVPRETRESVLHSMCARFPTVLGPGSDWYHEDHIHLDLMERRNNYRICQWNVWDPLPQIAPLLPAERPEEAPPREVAAKSEQGKSEQGRQARAGRDPTASGKPMPAKPRSRATPRNEKAPARPALLIWFDGCEAGRPVIASSGCRRPAAPSWN